MKAIWCSVNVDGVVVLLGGDRDTSTLHAVIKFLPLTPLASTLASLAPLTPLAPLAPALVPLTPHNSCTPCTSHTPFIFTYSRVVGTQKPANARGARGVRGAMGVKRVMGVSGVTGARGVSHMMKLSLPDFFFYYLWSALVAKKSVEFFSKAEPNCF